MAQFVVRLSEFDGVAIVYGAVQRVQWYIPCLSCGSESAIV